MARLIIIEGVILLFIALIRYKGESTTNQGEGNKAIAALLLFNPRVERFSPNLTLSKQ